MPRAMLECACMPAAGGLLGSAGAEQAAGGSSGAGPQAPEHEIGTSMAVLSHTHTHTVLTCEQDTGNSLLYAS